MSQGINSNLAAAQSYQAVLQKFDKSINLTFIDEPLKSATLIEQAPTPPITCLAYTSWPNMRIIMMMAIGLQIFEERLGIDRQKLMAGVSYKHTYFSEYIFGLFFHAFASAIFYLIAFKYDLRGFWLPSILYAFASPGFNQYFR